MKMIYLFTLLLTITSTASAVSATYECPSINDIESLAGQQCYSRLSCENDANGAPVYSVKVFMKNNEEISVSAASDKLPIQRDQISKNIATLMLDIAAASNGVSTELTTKYAQVVVKSCDSLTKGENLDAASTLIGFLAGLK
jgi:hypothetical protein